MAGFYGYGNLGDEAILEMSLTQVLQITDKTHITVLSGNKEATASKHGIDTINRYNILSIIIKLIQSDAIVFGGGSLLQDITSKRSIYYYLLLIWLAKITNNKIIMLSQGIGPIINQRSKNAVAMTLKLVDYITVRDKYSVELLESLKVDKEKIFLSADPVINITSTQNFAKDNTAKKKVCFAIRNFKNTDVSDKISEVAKMLVKNNIECYFIPFYFKEDLSSIYEIESILKDDCIYFKENLSTHEAFDIIKQMDLLVGVRLHSLIFAAAANVPFVAISYDYKVDHFANSVNMDVTSKIDNIDVNILYNVIMEKLTNEEQEKKTLLQNVTKLRELININYKILKEI